LLTDPTQELTAQDQLLDLESAFYFMLNMRPLYLILLLLWFIASYLLCNKYFICAPAGDSVSEVAAGAAAATAGTVSGDECIADIEFEDNDFLVSSTENFRFAMSEETQIEPSEDFKDILMKVSEYLSENPDRFMRLTGYYMDGEENASDHDDLGIARAKSVREYLRENGFSGTQLNTNGEMLESGCVKDGILQKGISIKFGEIPQ